MRAVRPLVVALATLVGGSACDRLPTEAPRPSAPSSQSAPTGLLSCSALPAARRAPIGWPAGGASAQLSSSAGVASSPRWP